MKIHTKLAWFLVLGFLPLFSGCNYYRISKIEPVSEDRLSAIPTYTHFLVYQGSNVWELKNVQVKEQVLEGSLQAVSQELEAYINPSATFVNRYRSRDKSFALNVVHLHIYEYAKGENDTALIPISAIKQLYTSEQDRGASAVSHMLVSVGAVATVLGLVFVYVMYTHFGGF